MLNVCVVQRYYINETFSKPDGPVFLMVGGETPAHPAWMVVAQWIRYAQKYGALCLLLEHRYYGKSLPTLWDFLDDILFGAVLSLQQFHYHWRSFWCQSIVWGYSDRCLCPISIAIHWHLSPLVYSIDDSDWPVYSTHWYYISTSSITICGRWNYFFTTGKAVKLAKQSCLLYDSSNHCVSVVILLFIVKRHVLCLYFDSDMSTENLIYLSSEQALADLANFRISMTESMKLQGRKWIAFGGSYPGWNCLLDLLFVWPSTLSYLTSHASQFFPSSRSCHSGLCSTNSETCCSRTVRISIRC